MLNYLKFIAIFFIFLFFPNYASSYSSYTTYDLEILTVSIPSSWQLENEKMLSNLNLLAQNLTGINQSDNKNLIYANYFREKKYKSASIRIGLRDEFDDATQESLNYITEDEINDYILPEMIKQSVFIDIKKKCKTREIKMEKCKISGFLCLKTIKIVQYDFGKTYKEVLYILPHDKYGKIKIYTTHRIDEPDLDTVINRIISSIKIK